MDFNTLRKKLAAEAKGAGICREWHTKILRAPNRECLLNLFCLGVDFAAAKDFPSDGLAAEFADIAPRFGIFIKQPVIDRYVTRKLIARQAAGAVTFDGFTAAEVYALRGAELNVTARGNAYVSITAEKGATVRAEAHDKAKIIITNHGGGVTVSGDRPDSYKVLTDKTDDHGNTGA